MRRGEGSQCAKVCADERHFTIRTPSPRRSAATLSLWERVAREGGAHFARARDIDGAADLFDHPVDALTHLCVREAQFQIAVRLDQSAPGGVSRALIGVVDAVEFDRQAEFETAEVGDEARQRDPPPELAILDPPPAQDFPKHRFGARVFGAQPPRKSHKTLGHGAIVRPSCKTATPPAGRGLNRGSQP